MLALLVHMFQVFTLMGFTTVMCISQVRVFHVRPRPFLLHAGDVEISSATYALIRSTHV